MTTAFSLPFDAGVFDIIYLHSVFSSKCQGAPMITRYEKGHLCSIFESCGFEVERFDYGKELDGQSGIYLRLAIFHGL